MNKITAVIPRKKSDKLKKILKKNNIKKYINLTAGKKFHKYEIIVTELKTQETIDDLKEGLDIHAGIKTSEGYITLHHTNIIAPHIVEKGKDKELKELTSVEAKKFIKFDREFILFTVCSTILACIGFQINSLALLIGAMIINPLMSPVMAVSYGFSRNNKSLTKKGLRTELLGILLILFVSLIVGFLPNPDFSLETDFAETNLYLGLLSGLTVGVVAASSFITGEHERLTGVAVSIALLPPLTNFILLLINNKMFAFNSLYLFILSILGMHLSSFIFFLIMKSEEES